VSQRFLVPFTGVGSGVETLTWGQEHIWQSMAAAGSSLAMTATRPLADGVTVDDLAEELRFYVTRFQAMRTLVRFDGDGRARQVVAGSGELAIEIVDVEADADPAAAADEVVRRHDDTIFDYEHEWPVRMVLLRRRGRPTHMVMTLSHHVADGAAAMVMYEDWVGRDPATGRPRGPVAAIEPLDLVRRQREPAALRQSEAALRYWEGLLTDIPASRFGEPTLDGGHRFWRLIFTSPALHLALVAAAARFAADPQSTLMATYAVALARVTGRNPIVAQLLVGNRFRLDLTRHVGPLIQPGLCVLDVADIPFAEAIARARRRALTAHKYAYFDRIRMNDLIARVNERRGETVDLGCIYNDRRGLPATVPAGPPPTEASVREALADTSLLWEKRLDGFNEKLMMNFNVAPDTVSVQVTVDTGHVTPPVLTAFLRELETVAIEAAFDPAPHSRVGHDMRVAAR
jgi:hypothetical protein